MCDKTDSLNDMQTNSDEMPDALYKGVSLPLWSMQSSKLEVRNPYSLCKKTNLSDNQDAGSPINLQTTLKIMQFMS